MRTARFVYEGVSGEEQVGVVECTVMGELIVSNPEILGGTPVSAGTRVPVRTLFEYLKDNYTLDQFLECFPTVTPEKALKVLAESENALLGLRTA